MGEHTIPSTHASKASLANFNTLCFEVSSNTLLVSISSKVVKAVTAKILVFIHNSFLVSTAFFKASYQLLACIVTKSALFHKS
jgi:hypothetical protein